MDSKKLEILMTAIDLGSFSKASEVVGYTQSGLTHLVDSLERDIGLTLVRRDHNGITLTREGETLVPSIREFLRANAKLENQIAAITDKKRDTIRVAAYASIAMHWMPEILYRFRRVCPNTDVDLRMVDNALEPFELLEKGRTDVIFAAKQTGYSCDWTPLCQDAMYAILPPEYPLGEMETFPIDAIRKVRSGCKGCARQKRREAQNPPVPRRRRDGHPHGRQGAGAFHDGRDDAARENSGCPGRTHQPGDWP